MTASRPRPESARSETTPRHGWLTTVGFLLLGGILALLVFRAARVSRPPAALTPPNIATNGLDPAIVRLITESIQAVHRSLESGAAWGTLGQVLQTYDFTREARTCFEHAETLDPNEPRWPWSQALLSLPDEAAVSKLRRTVVLCGGQPDFPRLKLIQALSEAGHLAEAETLVHDWLQAQPQHPAALFESAKLHLAQGRLEESARQLQQCLTDDHTAKTAYELLGLVRQRQGNTNAAQFAANAAAQLPPDLPWPDPFAAEAVRFKVGRQAWLDQAQIAQLQGRFDDAITLAQRLTQEYPQSPDGWLILGRVRLLQLDTAGAETALRQHLELNPNSVDGHTQLGLTLLRRKRDAEAVTAFQEALRRKPDFGEAHYNLALAYSRLGDATAAVRSLRDAIRCKPDALEPRLALVDVLLRTGNADEARTEFEPIAAMHAKDPRVGQIRQRLGLAE